jgi:hypothetical protein
MAAPPSAFPTARTAPWANTGGRALWLYPTVGAAIAAGLPWLSFSCPACGQFGSVNLRTLDVALLRRQVSFVP